MNDTETAPILSRWIFPPHGLKNPALCDRCREAKGCGGCPCGNDVHVVEGRDVTGPCYCGETPIDKEAPHD